MTVSLFTFVDLYDRLLASAANILTKGAEHATGACVSEAQMLEWRLAEDMHPLSFQLKVLCNFSRQWTARVAGLPVPADIADQANVAGFQAAIADARAYLAALTPAQFEGRDDLPLTVQITDTMEPTLPAGQWLTVFATTNLYFHLTTAYGILRHKGVALGKIDMFGRGL